MVRGFLFNKLSKLQKPTFHTNKPNCFQAFTHLHTPENAI